MMVSSDKSSNALNRPRSSRGNSGVVNGRRGMRTRDNRGRLEGQQRCSNKRRPLHIHSELEQENKDRNEDCKFQFTANSEVKNVPVNSSNILCFFLIP